MRRPHRAGGISFLMKQTVLAEEMLLLAADIDLRGRPS